MGITELTNLVRQVLEKLNLIQTNAKKVHELPIQEAMNPESKIPVYNPETEQTEQLEVQKIIDEVNGTYTNQLLFIGNITVVDNDLTIPAGCEWVISGVNYFTSVDSEFPIPFAEAGKTRIDIIVAKSTGILELIQGVESESVAVRPNIPLNTVLVTQINVTDNSFDNVNIPLNENELEAIHASNTPSASNPFATIADIVAGGILTPALDPVLGVGGISDKAITLKNTVNDKRKLVFDPNTINGPEAAIYEDDGAGNSVLALSLTSYALQLLGSVFGGFNYTIDPYSGYGITDGTSTVYILPNGLTVNGELYEWPNTAGGGKLASEAFVNALLEGIKQKDPVRVATTANITLSGTQTIDGVAVIAGDRVLVKNQTTQSQNGIYIVAGGAWQRSEDGNTANELTNALVPVVEGTVNANTTYRQQTTSIVLGTSNIVFQTYGTLVPDADSSTKGKMKLYTVMGTNTDGTITQALFKSEIDTLTTAVGNRKFSDVLLSIGGTYPATNGVHYIVASNTQTITDPSSPINGTTYTMFVPNCTLTLGGVAVLYSNAFIIRSYNGVAWVNAIYKTEDNFLLKSKRISTGYTFITGVATNSNLVSLLIPANTFAAGDMVKIHCPAWKSTSALAIGYDFYHDTVAGGMTNAIATGMNIGASTRNKEFIREIYLDGTTARNNMPVNSTADTPFTGGGLGGVTTFDWAVDNYINLFVDPSVTTEVAGIYCLIVEKIN